MTEARIWNYAVQILYNPILALVKASVLIFLLRLFGQKNGVRTYIIGLNTINILQMLAVFFAITLQCLPIEFNWDPTIRGGRCIDQRILYTSTASFTILTDMLVLLLPAYIFTKLKIPKKTKIALLFVFLLGGLYVFFIAQFTFRTFFTCTNGLRRVTVAGIARLIILVEGLFNLVQIPDPTYNIGFVTSAIETNLALITASAPALMPLLRSWFPNFFGQEPGITEHHVTVGKKVALQSMKSRIELRSNTPRGSEEESMTFNGIVRTNTRYDNNARL
jgi:hypothetical protein